MLTKEKQVNVTDVTKHKFIVLFFINRHERYICSFIQVYLIFSYKN